MGARDILAAIFTLSRYINHRVIILRTSDSGTSPVVLSVANEDTTGFLINEEACEDLEGWLQQFYLPLFEGILEEWYVDPVLWPQDRTLKLFKIWCDVEIHSMVFDLVDEPLHDDDFD